ncbi:MAG: lactoylglutathione lyase [Verrucomicrobia bacterium]|nr:lactoylglutathione lyase [Verrucomicrobiota bacterium]
MIKTIAHVCLVAKDMVKSIDFYENKLKLKRKFSFRKGPKLIGVYISVGPDNFIEIFQNEKNNPVNTGITHFCLETADIDAAIRELTAAGVECSPKKLGCDQAYQTWIKDPDGNKIELHQYMKNCAQLTGKDCEVDW